MDMFMDLCMKQILREGAGASVEQGHTVFAHYTGKLHNGQLFDSTVGKPHR